MKTEYIQTCIEVLLKTRWKHQAEYARSELSALVDGNKTLADALIKEQKVAAELAATLARITAERDAAIEAARERDGRCVDIRKSENAAREETRLVARFLSAMQSKLAKSEAECEAMRTVVEAIVTGSGYDVIKAVTKYLADKEAARANDGKGVAT